MFLFCLLPLIEYYPTVLELPDMMQQCSYTLIIFGILCPGFLEKHNNLSVLLLMFIPALPHTAENCLSSC